MKKWGMPEEWPLEKHHPYNQWLQKLHGVIDYPPSPEMVQAARRAHLAMITYQDEMIGELIAELKALKLYDNMLIVFLSDHGEMMGEKSMWFKTHLLRPLGHGAVVHFLAGEIRLGHAH